MKSIADILAEELIAVGIDVVYGLPGGENVDVLDALRRYGIAFVLVKSESAACMMAAVTARLRGTPGAVLTTLGPGAANAFTGIAHCHLDRAPVLLITAQSDARIIGRHTHQVLDLQAIFRPVTKFTAELDEHNPRAVIHYAMHVMQSGRPGPVHLALSSHLAGHIVPDDPHSRSLSPVQRIPPDEHIQSAAAWLAQAKRPVIIAGLGLEPDRPYDTLRQLAENLIAPVIDTPKSKGALPATHPLFAGTIGLTRSDPVYTILDEADCIIAVGFDVVELVKVWDQAQPLIWIARWQNQDPALPTECELIGSVTPVLERLSAAVQPATTLPDWGATRVAAFRDELAYRTLPAPQQGRILPQEVLRIIREHTPPDIIITTDVGSHKIFAALEWQALVPNRYFVSNGLSVMGYGLASAIAAARVTSEPAICITGDAGLAMVIGEMSLAAEYDLPVIVVLMNDSALDLIRAAQHRAGKPVHGTEFTNPDYAHIAAAYGYVYHRVTNATECETAIVAALQARRPVLMDVRIDPVSYPTTVQPNL